jgi:enoyl-CoA hydratase/carnithine racemase
MLKERIAANPPQQLRMSKRLLREALNVRFDTLLKAASRLQSLCRLTRDHEEAVQAFSRGARQNSQETEPPFAVHRNASLQS